MAKYRIKPHEIEAITFQELIEYGKANGANIVDGMPWSFEYKGYPITHENDECYLIPAPERDGHYHITPDYVLITYENGNTFPMKKKDLESDYDRIEE